MNGDLQIGLAIALVIMAVAGCRYLEKAGDAKFKGAAHSETVSTNSIGVKVRIENEQ